jgi:hypothetical protein
LKTLNLDELVTVERKVKLGGAEYPVVELSVGAFINSMKKANELKARTEKGEVIPVESTMESMIEAVQMALPDCPREKLDRLSFDALGVLMQFINGNDAPKAEGELTQTEDGGSEKKF